MAANVIGRRVFDMTNGWNGKPAASAATGSSTWPLVRSAARRSGSG